MDVLVTGANGFLGGALARALVKEGERVRVLARPSSRLQHLRDLPIDVRRGCLEDRASLGPTLEGVGTVYHCAGLSADWAPWNEFRNANILGVQNLLEAARAAGSVQRFVHISTTDVYGYPKEPCDENHALVDTGLPYNRSKVEGERRVWNFHRETDMPVTVIRPATIYGPRSLSCVAEIAELLLRKEMVYINSGRSAAGLLYIDNAISGIIQAGRSPVAVGQAYNLRDETSESWRQFIEALARGLDVPVPRRSLPGGLAWTIASLSEAIYGLLRIRRRPLLTRHALLLFSRAQDYPIGKARKELGFRSAVGFAEGMNRTLAWFNETSQVATQERVRLPARSILNQPTSG